MDEFCTSISAQERCPSVKFGISGFIIDFCLSNAGLKVVQ